MSEVQLLKVIIETKWNKSQSGLNSKSVWITQLNS